MNTTLRAYLVEDSLAATHHLARLLKEAGRVDVVGSSTLPMRALAEIPERAVDVLFLDIRMLRLDGSELLERMPANPQVVFVTGRDEGDAVRALEESGVLYVTTPLRRTRLSQTLDALEARRADPDRERPSVLLERLADYRLSPRVLPYADRIGVYFSRKGIRLLEVAAISHFLANDHGAVAKTPKGAGAVKRSLGELEQRLDPRTFVRIRRGVIVNLDWVESIEIWCPRHDGQPARPDADHAESRARAKEQFKGATPYLTPLVSGSRAPLRRIERARVLPSNGTGPRAHRRWARTRSSIERSVSREQGTHDQIRGGKDGSATAGLPGRR